MTFLKLTKLSIHTNSYVVFKDLSCCSIQLYIIFLLIHKIIRKPAGSLNLKILNQNTGQTLKLITDQ